MWKLYGGTFNVVMCWGCWHETADDAVITSPLVTPCRSAAAANLRAPPPAQLNSTADLQQLCTQQLGLCATGLLNPATADHARHLDNLGALQMKEAGKVGCQCSMGM